MRQSAQDKQCPEELAAFGVGELDLCDPLLCSLQTCLSPGDEVQCSDGFKAQVPETWD